MTSRAFGHSLYELDDLREAVASYTARACQKMRHHGLSAQLAQVFIQTNPFRQWEPQRNEAATVRLPVATNCTHEIGSYLQIALERIYMQGYEYHKAGVMMLELIPADKEQQSLFDTVDRIKSASLMKALDRINAHHGPGTLRYAAEGRSKTPDWRMKQAHKSKRYTTHLSELWEVS